MPCQGLSQHTELTSHPSKTATVPARSPLEEAGLQKDNACRFKPGHVSMICYTAKAKGTLRGDGWPDTTHCLKNKSKIVATGQKDSQKHWPLKQGKILSLIIPALFIPDVCFLEIYLTLNILMFNSLSQLQKSDSPTCRLHIRWIQVGAGRKLKSAPSTPPLPPKPPPLHRAWEYPKPPCLQNCLLEVLLPEHTDMAVDHISGMT